LTISGANSPEAGTPINGRVSGTVSGNMSIEFYASSGTPNAALVPGTSDGSTIPTGSWATLLFANSVTVTPLVEPAWSWTYQAGATCEQWTNALSGDTGDIVGVNHCS